MKTIQVQFSAPREFVEKDGTRHAYQPGTHAVPAHLVEHPYFIANQNAGALVIVGKAPKIDTVAVAPKPKPNEEPGEGDLGIIPDELPDSYNELVALAKDQGMVVSPKPAKADVILFLENKRELQREAEAPLA